MAIFESNLLDFRIGMKVKPVAVVVSVNLS